MNTKKTRQMTDESGNAPKWMFVILILAGCYNLIWGAFVIFFPLLPFQWASMAPPRYPELWQCIGMIVGVYGLGSLIAAFNPYRHWPIILVGFLGKVLVRLECSMRFTTENYLPSQA